MPVNGFKLILLVNSIQHARKKIKIILLLKNIQYVRNWLKITTTTETVNVAVILVPSKHEAGLQSHSDPFGEWGKAQSRLIETVNMVAPQQ